MVIGAVGALTVNSLDLLGKRASVRGWYSGTAIDQEDIAKSRTRQGSLGTVSFMGARPPPSS
jgi:hypothetical protein